MIGHLLFVVVTFLAACTAVSAQDASQPTRTVGRFVPLGVTNASRVWKLAHPTDESFIYLLDSASGEIEICSDVEGICRAIPGSQRDPKGSLIGRFIPVRVARATATWKSKHARDDYLVYSLDSTNSQLQVCGDLEGVCAIISDAHIGAQWPR